MAKSRIKCFMVEKTSEYTDININGISCMIFQRVDNGEKIASSDLPPGAMYWEREQPYLTPDRIPTLVVILPNKHHWYLNSRASNCTKKEDNEHRCWCVHGESPKVTVDKSCNTCNAGGGSILVGDYHGHLINGELVEC